MSKRYKVKRFSSCYLMNWVDNTTNKELTALEIEEILHKQEKRIAELEEQLKNKPKFNVGDKVYLINKDEEVERDFIESIDIDTFGIEYYTELHSICWYENELFSTKDEAERKLAEIGGKDE